VNNSCDLTKCDEDLGEKVKQSTDTDELMSKFTSILTATCDEASEVSSAGDPFAGGRRIGWWRRRITIPRRRELILRRGYQMRRNDCAVTSSKKYTSDYLILL